MVSVLSVVLAALAVPVQAAVVTEIDYVTQYAYENYDVIVDPQGHPITTSIEIVSTGTPPAPAPTTTQSLQTSESAAAPAPSHTHSSPENYNYISVSSSTSASASEAATAPAVSTASSSSSPPPPPAPTTTSSSSSTPAPTPTTTSSPPPAPPAVKTTSSSSAPAPPPPVTTTPTSSSAPAPSSTSSPGGGQFSGDATFYEVGLGACGKTNVDTDLIAALNYEQWDAFGSMSNGNPACGKTATVHYQGKSVTVTIQDKCPGCKYGDLDLSPAAFQQLADEGAGRIHVTWSFN